jgi:hypothetical protein
MLHDLFVVGGLGFYILLLAAIGFEFFCMDRDWGIGATVCLVLWGVLVWLGGNFNFFLWIAHNRIEFLTFTVGYFVIGIFWSFFKWGFWNAEQSSEVRAFKSKWLSQHDVPTLDSMKLPDCDRYNTAKKDAMLQDSLAAFNKTYLEDASRAGLAERDEAGELTTRPQFRLNHKSRVLVWLSYWPFSFIWTFAHDFVHKIGKMLVTALSSWYQAIADKFFKGTDTVV